MRVNGCCCCKLRTAGLILGWLGIILLILGFFSTIGRIVTSSSKHETELTSNIARERRKQDMISLVVSAIDILISGLLIAGIVKNKQKMMLPWLILRGIGLVLIIPFCLLVLLTSQLTLDPVVIVISLLIALIVGLCAWAWIVMYSLYHEIRDSKNRPSQISMGTPYYQNRP